MKDVFRCRNKQMSNDLSFEKHFKNKEKRYLSFAEVKEEYRNS